jgi:hypothetical protein
MKRPEDALASYDRAIALQPDYAEAYSNRGVALLDLKRLDDALASFDKAIALKPGSAEAHSPEDALASLDNAVAVKPGYATAHYNRANVLLERKRPGEALASYDQAIALNPGYAEAYWNQSLCLLLMGHFEQGFRQYEWRKKRDEPTAARSFPQPLWLGEENIAGKTLFVHWEQGLGDTIQFCRYAPLLEGRGAKVIMSVQQPLRGLLKQISPTIQIMGPIEQPNVFDFHCPLLSLPLAMGTTLETIPTAPQYLRVDEALRAAWADRLPPTTKLRIGVAWSGGAGHKNDHNRSIEMATILPMFSMDAQWICLQKEIKDSDSAALAQAGNVAFFGDELKDFSDTAALLDLMDLVISVDTSVTHLAGAMGKPVWILLSYSPDWRWLLDRDDSPWYPSVRLFRQQEFGNWPGVIDRVNNQLRSMID